MQSIALTLLLFLATATVGCKERPPQETLVPTTFSPSPTWQLPASAPLKIESVNTAPVLKRGIRGTWDGIDLLNPSVVRFHDILFNYYSGFDGQLWRTGIATSTNGTTWSKYPGNPVLEPQEEDWDTRYITANGSAIVHDGIVLYFYQGADQDGHAHIGLARSSDGFHFEKHPTPVLGPGDPHTWESEAVADPYVFEKGGHLYLYYLGMDDLGVQRLGMARSKHGLSWQRLPSNPILDVGASGTFDENGLGEPSIAYQPPYFYMLYTGRDSQESRNIGYAISMDGAHWKKMSTAGLVAEEMRESWNSKVVCDTTLLPIGNARWMVWFGGGNKSEPAENLDGEVGLMTLDLGQNHNMTRFEANSDWSESYAKSTDVLRGSYEIEGERGERFAWLGPLSNIALLTNESVTGKTLTVEGWVPAKMFSVATKQTGPQTIALLVHGKTLVEQSFNANAMFTLTAPWSEIEPLLCTDGMLELEIKSNRSIEPSLQDAIQDARILSFTVKSIRFQ